MKLLSILLLSLTIITIPATSSSVELHDLTSVSSKTGEHNFRPLMLDSKGLVQIGNDGIARSLDGDGNVIDYHILPNTTDYHSLGLFQSANSARVSTGNDDPSALSYYPWCLGMFCYDTHSCRVAGCYACIQTQNRWRETVCVARPAWYPPPGPRW